MFGYSFLTWTGYPPERYISYENGFVRHDTLKLREFFEHSTKNISYFQRNGRNCDIRQSCKENRWCVKSDNDTEPFISF